MNELIAYDRASIYTDLIDVIIVFCVDLLITPGTKLAPHMNQCQLNPIICKYRCLSKSDQGYTTLII